MALGTAHTYQAVRTATTLRPEEVQEETFLQLGGGTEDADVAGHQEARASPLPDVGVCPAPEPSLSNVK